MRIIGIWSPAPQSGKTTIANMLTSEAHFERVPFAGTLKEMMRVLLLDLGYSQTETTLFMRGDKTCELRHDIPTTLRHALQTLGTEWGRMSIDRELWIKAWKGHVVRVFESPLRVDGIVVDDVRFPNEVEAIRDLGGDMWVVTRPEAERLPHASEAMRLVDVEPDRVFVNDAGVDDLLQKARAAI